MSCRTGIGLCTGWVAADSWARPVVLIVALLSIGPAYAPAQTVAAAMDQYLRGRVEQSQFSGSVLVAQGGKILLDRGYGMANWELQVPATPMTIYRIGSDTKPFTAALTLRLVADGKIKLVDSVCRFVQACPTSWEPITIHHLLSHSSGIPDFYSDDTLRPAPSGMSSIVDGLIRAWKDSTVFFVPGSRYQYSNSGYVLLGYVTEKVAGKQWGALLADQIVIPAKLQNTRLDDAWEIIPGRARGHKFRRGVLLNAAYDEEAAYTAGGVISTAPDLYRFMRALRAGVLLPDSLVRLSFVAKVGAYGYGWQTLNHLGRPTIGHSGGVMGFASYMGFFPAEDLYVVVLNNNHSESPILAACDLAAIALGAKHELYDGRQLKLQDNELDRFSGRFSDSTGLIRDLAVRGGFLMYQRPGGASTRLIPVSRDRFRMDGNMENVVQFGLNPDSLPETIRVRSCGREIYFGEKRP